MTLALLVGSKISVIEANTVTPIEFPTVESALSALVKHQWTLVTSLERSIVLFQNTNADPLQHIEQLKMTVRLAESVATRKAVSRLSIESNSTKHG